jgi:hypothetical protein
MHSSQAPLGSTCGTTRVLECCTFEWWETTNGFRFVALPDGVHAECLTELVRAVSAQGVSMTLIRE